MSTPYCSARGLSQISWCRSFQSSFNWNEAPLKRAHTSPPPLNATLVQWRRALSLALLSPGDVWSSPSALELVWRTHHVWRSWLCRRFAPLSQTVHRLLLSEYFWRRSVTDLQLHVVLFRLRSDVLVQSVLHFAASVFDLFTWTNFVFYELVCLHQFCYSHTVLRPSWRGRRTMRIILLIRVDGFMLAIL